MLQKLQNNSSKHSNSTVRIEPRPRSENRRKHLERNWNSNRRNIYIYIPWEYTPWNPGIFHYDYRHVQRAFVKRRRGTDKKQAC